MEKFLIEDYEDKLKRYRANIRNLKLAFNSVLWEEIRNVLISKGFTLSGGHAFTWIDKAGKLSINYQYIYSNHVHLMFSIKDRGELFSSIGNIKWHYKKVDFKTFFENGVEQMITDINSGKIKSTGLFKYNYAK